MDFHELRDIAVRTLKPRQLTASTAVGQVAAALLTDRGHVYCGVCIDTACSIGFCAEHAAIAAMITAGENQIVKLVAVGEDGSTMPPCGRCRELICQIHNENINCEVLLVGGHVATVGELLPHRWN